MADLSVQDILPAGAEPTMTAASATGDTFTNTDRTLVLAVNANVSARTITVAALNPQTTKPAYGTIPFSDLTVNVPANGQVVFAPTVGPYTSGGKASMTYDDQTDLTLAVLRRVQD